METFGRPVLMKQTAQTRLAEPCPATCGPTHQTCRRGRLDAGSRAEPQQVPDSRLILQGTCLFRVPGDTAPSVRHCCCWPARRHLPRASGESKRSCPSPTMSVCP